MAAKKSSAGAVGTWVGVAVAVIGLYLTYKWLTAPRAQSSLPAGFVGGSYGGGGVSPYGAQQTSSSSGSSLLQGLLNALQGKKSGGSVSLGSGGGSGSSAQQQLPQSLQDQIAAIGGFSTIANNAPLSELGGASLETFDPGAYGESLLADYSIPSQPTSLFDLGGMAFSPSAAPDIALTDTGLGDASIPMEQTGNFDLSGIAMDPGGDLATVPIGVGGPDLSSSFGGNSGLAFDPGFDFANNDIPLG